MVFSSIFRNVNVTLLCITNMLTMLYAACPEKWSFHSGGGEGGGGGLGPLFLNFLDPLLNLPSIPTTWIFPILNHRSAKLNSLKSSCHTWHIHRLECRYIDHNKQDQLTLTKGAGLSGLRAGLTSIGSNSVHNKSVFSLWLATMASLSFRNGPKLGRAWKTHLWKVELFKNLLQ